MSLNSLGLASLNGVQGASFRAAVIGLTAGTTVEITNDSAPGMGYANGFVYCDSLPYDVNGVGLVERLPGGKVSLTSHNVITASDPRGYSSADAPPNSTSSGPS